MKDTLQDLKMIEKRVPRILLADNEQRTLKHLGRFLKDYGYAHDTDGESRKARRGDSEVKTSAGQGTMDTIACGSQNSECGMKVPLRTFQIFSNSCMNWSGVSSISRSTSRIRGRARSLPGWHGSVVVLPSACL